MQNCVILLSISLLRSGSVGRTKYTAFTASMIHGFSIARNTDRVCETNTSHGMSRGSTSLIRGAVSPLAAYRLNASVIWARSALPNRGGSRCRKPPFSSLPALVHGWGSFGLRSGFVLDFLLGSSSLSLRDSSWFALASSMVHSVALVHVHPSFSDSSESKSSPKDLRTAAAKKSSVSNDPFFCCVSDCHRGDVLSRSHHSSIAE